MAESSIRRPDRDEGIVDALGATIVRVRTLFSHSRSAMSLARYDIGVEVRRVMANERKYGKHAVRRVAGAIGRGEDDLYRYALLPAAWSREVFAALCLRPTKKSVPLSLSHLVAIAKQPRVEHDHLVRFAFEGPATVRQLEAEARRLLGVSTTKPSPPREPRVALRRGIRQLGRRLDLLETLAKELPEEVEIAEALAAIRGAHRRIVDRVARSE